MYPIVSIFFFYVIMGKKNYDRINYAASYHFPSRYKWTTTLFVPIRITHLFTGCIVATIVMVLIETSILN